MLKIGLTNELSVIVSTKNTAKCLGSGDLDVFATPSMIALVEQASANLAMEYLEDDMSTVGTKVDITHIAATPIDMKVTAKSELIEIDNRRLVFKVSCYDEKELIGQGLHERFIINKDKFMSKLKSKI